MLFLCHTSVSMCVRVCDLDILQNVIIPELYLLLNTWTQEHIFSINTDSFFF